MARVARASPARFRFPRHPARVGASPTAGRGKPIARSLAHLARLVAFHRSLLADARRNRAFHAALAARIGPRDAVLDVGAGTGLWAVAAARLGARRVVAIEKEELLVPLIRALASENGVADRVEVVSGRSLDVDLRREFDVIVSETVGNLGFDEHILPLIADARTRLLRRGGALIPGAIALLAAPVRDAAPPRGRFGVTSRAFSELALHFTRDPDRGGLRLLARPRELVRVDLYRTVPEARLDGLVARWRVSSAQRIAGIAVWVRMELAPGIRLETLSGTHWTPTVLGVEPLPRASGLLTARIDLGSRTPRWQVELVGPKVHVSRSYDPRFAYGWLGAQPR